MGENAKLSSMITIERAIRSVKQKCRHNNNRSAVSCYTCLADSFATAEQEAHAAGRKAERERVVEWIKAEARDCGCWERILKNVEAADG